MKNVYYEPTQQLFESYANPPISLMSRQSFYVPLLVCSP